MDVNITSTLTTHLANAPSGGWLAHLLVVGEQRAERISYATTGLSQKFPVPSLCALDLLTVSGFSSLDPFVGSSDYPWLLDHMRLSEGALFPVAVMLPVATARGLDRGTDCVPEGNSRGGVRSLRERGLIVDSRADTNGKEG